MKKLMMSRIKWAGFIILLVCSVSAHAFTTVDEQIDHYLNILATGSNAEQVQMLERLQWSGLNDPRLFDEVERQLLEQYQAPDMNKYDIALLSHKARALSYSGNDKYRISLEKIKNNTAHKRLRRHAIKALNEMAKYSNSITLVANSGITVEGKSAEVTNYMKMLNVDDAFIQRQAARAIFFENQQDPDLLALTAKILEGFYLQDGLSKPKQDTAAWFCRALGQSGVPEYRALLSDIVKNSPYKKIKKYAKRYTQ